MLKKSLKIAFLASVAISAISATNALADDSAFDGAYFGAEAGGAFGQAKENDTNGKAKLNGFAGGLFGGYGATFDNFYLGGELYAHYRNLDDKDKLSATESLKVKNNRAFGASFRPGYLVTENTLFYGRVGYENAHFDYKYSDAAIPADNWKKEKNTHGLVLGAGIEHAFESMENVKLRLDYRYVNYREFKIANTKVDAYTNNVMLGVSYTF